jgi:signal peptidase II
MHPKATRQAAGCQGDGDRGRPTGTVVFSLVALGILFLDQITKLIIVRSLTLGQAIPVVPGLFNIVYVLNPGAAFGFLASLPDGVRNPFFVLISVAAAVLIVAYHARHLRSQVLPSLALGLILGGAVGNLIDRLRYGMVVDFLDFYLQRYHWPAFNVADSAISAGVGLMMLDMLLEWRRERGKAGQGAKGET